MERPPGRVVGIDALRALAALAVFVCHLGQYWRLNDLPLKLPELVAVGAHGVDLFIVLSGFVLGLAALRTDRQLLLGNFLARRGMRLLPSYYVALACAAVIALSPAATWIVAERASAADVAWHVALLQTWSPELLGTINGSLWSVALEAQLYLLFPLLVLWARRWGAVSLVVVTALLSVVLSTADIGSLGGALTQERNLPIRLVQFAVGLACARVHLARRVPSARALWAVLLGGGLAAMLWTTADVEPGRVVVWSIPCAAAILLVAGPGGARLASMPLERWGLASYSFYLLHQPIVLVTGHVLRPHLTHDVAALLVGTVVALPLTALAAWLLYVGVERPSHRFGRRRFAIVAPGPDPARSPR